MVSERWSLESTVINTSSVTVVEGEAGEGAICGVSYQFQSVTVTTIGDLKNRYTHVTRSRRLTTNLTLHGSMGAALGRWLNTNSISYLVRDYYDSHLRLYVISVSIALCLTFIYFLS
jgi:hypothetical protein